ncbi:NAD(P)/FAD-dependent oxidoreductase [Microcoleus sp. FACHB-672]|uniref:NAD(P)/FAD-dependent oxidoreductase n=1 Tax=Microcoleus sp. FACHB-672 TaxID=2692825 RepID=UPI001689C54A|nr:FAD-dependent oxidoreductase [Microcoleus sp. FACHB-672]MBD2042030.1 FAD-dependent oxidoreductase [Microcoleus sp. FACHB-672]
MTDSSLTFDVAVIGAGMAGLTCAQLLHQAGYSTIVLEKSRGLGGRVATRRVQEIRADHGGRYLEPKGQHLRRLVHILSAHNIVELWTDKTYIYDENKGLTPAAPSSWCPYYVAPAGMNAVGKFLATGLEIWLSRRVLAMTPTDQGIWQLLLESPDTLDKMLQPQEVNARAVVMAIPAPQAVTILEPMQTELPADFIANLRSVEFEPCLSVIAGYSPYRQQDLAQREIAWKTVVFPHDDQLAWIGWDSSKRTDSQMPVFVANSSASFAQDYLEAEDLQPAGQMLLDRAGEYLNFWLNSPDWLQVHRWRYAFVSRPIPETYLAAATPVPVVCCGDWCGGNQIEGALESGKAAAEQINQQLRHLPMPGEGFWDVIARE